LSNGPGSVALIRPDLHVAGLFASSRELSAAIRRARSQ
jgi:hypothetical protein